MAVVYKTEFNTLDLQQFFESNLDELSTYRAEFQENSLQVEKFSELRKNWKCYKIFEMQDIMQIMKTQF